MLREPGLAYARLTMYERGRVDELHFISKRLRDMAELAGDGGIDPKVLEHLANMFEIRCEYISEYAQRAAANGTTQVVLGAPGCLYGRDEQWDSPMPPVQVWRPARTLEDAASDVAVAASSLYGLQSAECVEVLAELADELLQAARALREMSEGMEDGDE